jgi:hypothetical protein
VPSWRVARAHVTVPCLPLTVTGQRRACLPRCIACHGLAVARAAVCMSGVERPGVCVCVRGGGESAAVPVAMTALRSLLARRPQVFIGAAVGRRRDRPRRHAACGWAVTGCVGAWLEAGGEHGRCGLRPRLPASLWRVPHVGRRGAPRRLAPRTRPPSFIMSICGFNGCTASGTADLR